MFLTLWIVLLSIGTSKVYSAQNSKRYNTEMTENTSAVNTVEIEVLNCAAGEIKKGKYILECQLELSNLPQNINIMESQYEINFASDEYFAFTPQELKEQTDKPGLDKEYMTNVYNHILGMSYFSVIEKVDENAVIGSFKISVPTDVSPNTIHVVRLDIYDNFDKYLSSPRKDSLFD